MTTLIPRIDCRISSDTLFVTEAGAHLAPRAYYIPARAGTRVMLRSQISVSASGPSQQVTRGKILPGLTAHWKLLVLPTSTCFRLVSRRNPNSGIDCTGQSLQTWLVPLQYGIVLILNSCTILESKDSRLFSSRSSVIEELLV